MLADSSKRSGFIHEGMAQCSSGIVSGRWGVRGLWLDGVGWGSGFTIVAFGFCDCLGFSFELGVEWFVVEKGPGVVEFVVPGPFEVNHRLDHTVHLVVPH